MSHPGLTINCTTDSAVHQHRIVTVGSARGHVTQATAGAKAIGVCNQPGETASGRRVDVVMDGIAEVEFGGAVAAGDWIAADADGKGVSATTGNVIGFALHAAVSGEIGDVRIAPACLGSVQAP